MALHNDLGNIGENRAVDYLLTKEYVNRHRNWMSGKKEIDIVAQKDNMLIIIEVKTRSTEFFEHPKEAITKSKIKNLVQAAEDYIFEFDIMLETRFDVVSVIPKGDTDFVIEHIEDAFLPPIC